MKLTEKSGKLKEMALLKRIRGEKVSLTPCLLRFLSVRFGRIRYILHIMRQHFVQILVVLLLAGPHTVSVATSPVTPFHLYSISGTLVRAAGMDRSNFTVALSGKFASQQYIRLSGRAKNSPAPVSITDSSGRFWISVYDVHSYDSLRLMVIIPGGEPLFASPFPRTSATSVINEYGTFTHNVRGCTGCGDPASSTIITEYRYSFPEQLFELGF